MKKLFILTTLVVINLSGGSQADKSPLRTPFTYAHIAKLYLPTFSPVQKMKSSGINAPAAELSAEQRRQLLLSLLAKYYPAEPGNTLFDMTTLTHDLNIVSYQSKDRSLRRNSLLHRFIPLTKTVCGEAALAYMITHPLSDATTLQARQALIRACTHPELADVMRAVGNLKGSLDVCFSCFIKPKKMEAEAIRALYWRVSALNKEYLLGLSSKMGDLTIIAIPLLAHSSLGLIAYIPSAHFGYDKGKQFGKGIMTWSLTHPYLFSGSAKQALREVLVDCLGPGPEDQVSVTTNFVSATQTMFNWVSYLFTYLIFKGVSNRHKTTQYIQRKLIACADLVRTVALIEQAAETCPPLKVVVENWRSRCKPATKDFKKLVEMLQTNTFTGSPSYFSRIGRVKAAYQLLESTKDELISYMELVGIVDAHHALAQYILAHQDGSTPYSFATYIDAASPYVHLEDFRNPLLQGTHVVGNDITFGTAGDLGASQGSRGAIVTGSNTAGKSTVMVNGLGAALVLAHTLTIVPAKKCELTPFQSVATALKVTDNVARGQSHARAEVDQRNKLLALVQEASKSQGKVFLLIDELFEGLPPQAAGNGLKKFGHRLSQYPNVLFVMATQLKDAVTTLEKETGGVCQNYCVDVVLKPDNTIERPFKVAKGISSVNIATQLLEDDELEDESLSG